jgi:hypothetical protein
MQLTHDLARWPSGGNRRRLEDQWLGQLERHGLPAFLPEPPAKAPLQLPKAIEQFNGESFWDCHETLEAVWLETPYPLRLFYHSIIKTAVGFHHMRRHNRYGARVKLSDGVRLLRLFSPEYMGVRTGRLLEDSSGWLARVTGAGRLDWAELDLLGTPTIHTV